MKFVLLLFFAVCYGFCTGQQIEQHDSLRYSANKVQFTKLPHLKVKALYIPAALITYGFAAINNGELKEINTDTKTEITEDHPVFATKLDNYLQYAPAISVYALNTLGIKGKNNFRDRTMIYGLSTLISSAFVLSIKNIAKVQRPDGSGFNSFPSGHTTTAFAAAEFLRMEYTNVSPWYGIAGYAAAATTGVLRLYNNKHWVNDVVAGAGFGILSTKLSYWIYPEIKKHFFKNKPMTTTLLPWYQQKSAGVAMVYHFAR